MIILTLFLNQWTTKALKSCLPNIAYMSEENVWSSWVEEKLETILPVYSFMTNQIVVIHRQDSFLLKKIKPYKAYFADKACADKIIALLVATAVETEEEPAKDEAPKAE